MWYKHIFQKIDYILQNTVLKSIVVNYEAYLSFLSERRIKFGTTGLIVNFQNSTKSQTFLLNTKLAKQSNKTKKKLQKEKTRR